jgi:ribosomal peptide maturation radical SAM protein 1
MTMALRVELVTMPWQRLDAPSIALGILRKVTEEHDGVALVHESYLNLAWAEFLLQEVEPPIEPDLYSEVAEVGFFFGVGEWIFSGAIDDVAPSTPADYFDYLSAKEIELPLLQLEHMWRLAPRFVQQQAESIVGREPDVVGFTTTFMQNTSSLALAKAIRARRPETVIVFGGGNCDGPQGVQLHQSFDFLDFVARGEGERLFPALLDVLLGRRRAEEVAGLCWRSPGGESVANPSNTAPLPAEEFGVPDYSAYFTLLGSSPLAGYVVPKLVVETSRGCWWGQRQHCTFCGLNGSTMEYRSKSPAAALREIEAVVRRFRVLDVLVVDNIMDADYLGTLLPDLANRGWDLNVHYEIKSNLNAADVRALRQAGVRHIQPGIESLSTRVLRLMRKGVNALQNVRLLRQAEEQGITVSWNYLYGFPGEDASDYTPVIEQAPRLTHLQPPSGASRIVLERFSPFFEDASLGFLLRRPADFYRYIYRLDTRALRQMVYLFDTTAEGIGGALEKELIEAMLGWRRDYVDSELTWVAAGSEVHIRDRRTGWPASDLVLDQGWEVASWRLLEQGISAPRLRKEIGKALGDTAAGEVTGFIEELDARGLVFREHDAYVTLAVPAGASRTPKLGPP